MKERLINFSNIHKLSKYETGKKVDFIICFVNLVRGGKKWPMVERCRVWSRVVWGRKIELKYEDEK